VYCENLKVVESKENVKPETDVKKSTEYRKNVFTVYKKRTKKV